MRRADSSQLTFVFADSPRQRGGKSDEAADASAAKAWLLHIADGNEAGESVARSDDANHLMEQAASTGNLALALLKVARNKGAAGVDGRSVNEVVEHARTLLPKLRRSLLTGDYQPGAIRRVWIPKPGSPASVRGLGIPNVVDRVVQQAVLQLLEPIFEPTFHNSSHGFRPRRGAQTAIAEAKAYVEQGYDHVVDIDLSKFFDRVNHQRLLGRMSQQVEDDRVLKLIGRMLKAKVVMPDGTVVLTEEGTPQGGPLSPLLSNIVLDELDQELSRRGLRFVRYADDFMVFVRSERSGHRVMGSIRRFIEGRLRLKINDDKSSVARPEQLHFLGFTLWRRNDGSVEVDLSKRSIERINTRIRELTPRSWGGSFNACVAKVNEYLRGWYGYFRLCTKRGVRRFSQIDAHTRRRLRAIIVRQKGRRPRFLYRHLRKCGVPEGSARKAAYVCRGVWRRSCSYGIHRAYGNDWFAERLMVLWDRWQQDHAEPSRVWHRQLELFG